MKCLSILSIIVMILATGEAIRCYDGVWVDESFDSSKAIFKECNVDNNVCGKLELRLSNGTKKAERACTFPREITSRLNQLEDKSPPVRIISSSYNMCETDLCNSARSISSNFVIIFSTIISIMLVIRNMH